MRIVFERGTLQLRVDPGEPLHAEAFEVLSEADASAQRCLRLLEPRAGTTACDRLALSATHALTHGRDERVVDDFREIERELHRATEGMRVKLFDNVLYICVISFLLGGILALLWIIVEPRAPWNKLPEGLDLAVNYVFLISGWTGFTLVGFSVGWLFLKSATIRNLDREVAALEATSLRQRKANIFYHVLLCLILNIALFFLGGFEKIDDWLENILVTAPWAILLGMVLGVAEPTLAKRVQGFFSLS